eukprot:c20663_g2_i1 orf=1-279(-)
MLYIFCLDPETVLAVTDTISLNFKVILGGTSLHVTTISSILFFTCDTVSILMFLFKIFLRILILLQEIGIDTYFLVFLCGHFFPRMKTNAMMI